ncbi:MAG: metal-dependent transcriptional regulator [Lachnospiraceae bacterium]|nr:metal-dependent transcriptional regulator [Lachnospiraceae bacterium]
MSEHTARENYLKAILSIKDKKGYVRSIDIANELSVSRPSVSYATKQLREDGLITVNDDGMITLTDEGKSIAKNVQEKYNTLSQFFINLGVEEEMAKEDAHRIEHDISQESFDALLKFISSCGVLASKKKGHCKNKCEDCEE